MQRSIGACNRRASAHIDTHRRRIWPHRHGETGAGV